MATIETEVTPAEVLERIPTEDDVAFMARTLDRARPGWAEEIDLDTLNLEGSHNCVTGQTWHSFTQGQEAMSKVIGIETFQAVVFKLADADQGVGYQGPFHDNRHLPRWREEVEARR